MRVATQTHHALLRPVGRDKQEECPFGLAPERPLHGRAGRTEVRTALQRGHDISCPYKEKQGPGFPIKVIGAPA